jgi:hypothetical protein
MDDLGNVFGAKFNYVNNSGELGDLIERGFDDYNRKQRKKITDPIVTTAKVGGILVGIFGTQILMQITRQIPGVDDYLNKHSKSPIVEILDKNTGLTKCSKSRSVVEEKVVLQLKLTGNYDFSGEELSGKLTIEVPEKGTYTGFIGESLDLLEVDKNKIISGVKIIMEADGAHKKIYNNIILKAGNNIISGLKALDTEGFNPEGFANYFLEQLNGKNATYVGDKIKCFIDPNLPKDFISETKDAMNEIAGYAGIETKFVMEKKSNPGNAPPDDEFWVNSTTDLSGVINKSYPDGGSVVKSGKVFYNLNSSTPSRVRKEVMDVFIQANQNIFLDDYLANWFRFALTKRPQGDDQNYRFYPDYEVMDGLDEGSSSTMGVSKIKIYRVDDSGGKSILNPTGECGMRSKIGGREEFPHNGREKK